MVTTSKTWPRLVQASLTTIVLSGLTSCHVPGTVLHAAADTSIGAAIDGYCIALTADGTRRTGTRYSKAAQPLPASLGVEAHGEKTMVARLDGYVHGVRVASTAQSIELSAKDPTLMLASCAPGRPTVSASSFVLGPTVNQIADRLAFIHTGLEAPGGSSFAALGTGVGLVATYAAGAIVQTSAPKPTSAVNGLVSVDAYGVCADDLVFAGAQNALWHDGTDGTFVSGAPLAGSLGAASALAAGDLNGDGVPDLVGVGASADANYVLIGDGHGGYAKQQAFDTAPMTGQAAALGDLDRDGVVDLVVGFTNAVRVWRGDGHGNLLLAGPPNTTGNVASLALVDLDGDGNLDIVAAELGGAPGLHVLLNDGSGTFADATSVWVPSTLETDGQTVAVADVDGDCKLEVLFGGKTAAPHLLGIGSASLQDRGQIGTSSAARALGAADLDGDGLPELVIASFTGVEVYVRQGSGS